MRLNWSNIGRGLEAIASAKQASDLAKAYGLTPQEQQAPMATPEQLAGAQAETRALAAQDAEMFGLAPQDMQRYAPAMPQEGARTGMSTYRLGEQVFQRAPTQAEIDAARTRAAADVYGRYGDTARREELLRGLRAEQRAQTAEERAAQQFETQQRTAGLTQQQLQQQIAAGGRTAAAAERMDAFTQWAQQNPDQSRDFAAVSAKARELRMTPDEQFKVASNLTGIDEAEFKASQSRIRKLVANQGLDGLLKAHRDSNDLDPGSHFEQVRGKDGAITLNRVDTATGRIIQPNVFSGKEAEVVGYLNKAAMDPATIVDYTMNLRKTQAAIEASEAQVRASDALARQRIEGDGASATAKKIADFKKVFDRDPTEAEKLTMFGLVSKPREVSNADVISLSKELVGKPTGRLVDGKPERYTEATSIAGARALLEQQPATPGLPSWGAAPTPTAATTAAPAPSAQPAVQRGLQQGAGVEPRNREEFALAARAREQGLYPVGRGNAIFGAGELLFEDNAGRRVWASQIR